MKKNVATQIVELLEKAGVRHVYAVAGDSLNYFNIAVKNSEKIDWVHVRHEEVGAFAASAESQFSGIGCCAGSSGPGHVHLVNGVYDAHKSRTPMIVIASTCATTEFGTEYYQETNTITLFDDCSCFNQMITRAEQVPRIVQMALQRAIDNKDVAVIGLPGDVAEMEAVENNFTQEFFYNRPIVIPQPSELQKAAAMINEAKTVTLYCGVGASEAADEVIALSKKLNAPVGYSYRGKMYIQGNNPNEVGMTGFLGLPAAYHAMHECELLIMIGTDFPYKAFIPNDRKIIQIELEGGKIGRRGKVDLGLMGNSKETIQHLMDLIEEKKDRTFLDKQLALYDVVKQRKMVYVDDNGTEDRIRPEYVAYQIDLLSKDDAIYTVDTGLNCVWASRYITGNGKRRMLACFRHGSMANAMPHAMGIQLAHPDKQVIAFCGDGGLSMLLGDLSTIKQYKLPVKLIIFNNRAIGQVKMEMEIAGITDNETDMDNPDYAMVAQGMGIKAENVHKPEDVIDALKRAFEYDGPYILSVFTDPDHFAVPPKASEQMIEGFTKSMEKLMLGGKMQEEMDIINSNIKHIDDLKL